MFQESRLNGITIMSPTAQPLSTKALEYLEGPPMEGEPQVGWKRFVSFVESQPDKVAITSIHQPSGLYPKIPQSWHADAASSCLRWTYRDLKVAIDRLALRLRSRGVRSGSIIVTLLPNGVESVVVRLTASFMGCAFAPLNPKHLVNKDEVAHLLRLFLRQSEANRLEKAAVLVAADEHVAARVEDEQTHFANRCIVKIMCPQDRVSQEPCGIASAATSAGWCCFQELMQEQLDIPQLLDTPPSSHGAWSSENLILCTSGTTSLPKACLWTASQIAYRYHVLEQSGLFGLSTEDNVLVCLSNNHIAGYDALSCALFFGGTAVISGPAFDVDEFVGAAVQESVTFTILVPTSESVSCLAPSARLQAG